MGELRQRLEWRRAALGGPAGKPTMSKVFTLAVPRQEEAGKDALYGALRADGS